ncbi:hypothetical protein [Bartonella sp. HY761]|nr:hypothetical protein [Bartonella sp. HY761]UXN06311.1 hypothetical protein N6A79_13750 [Bartonella sp. HY761]
MIIVEMALAMVRRAMTNKAERLLKLSETAKLKQVKTAITIMDIAV